MGKKGIDKKMLLFVAVLTAIGLLIVGAVIIFSLTSGQHQRLVVINDTNITVQVVQTAEDRQHGLSGVKNLKPGHGMLFIFPGDSKYGIWMKDMRFALDIIWLDKDKKIVHIEKDIQPDTYPTIFYPSVEARYVIEVPSGFTNQNNISEGMVASF